ncbi:hypothetical protein RHGRI_035688 [Rhododendron griersonianum]|uniref:NADH-plastoquinone oxidoreductase subunit K n=1 Tax=Rhododendron griersonianum TaxID=479676 RepID=A0AAV6HP92_9ERIC|nr:hypothetical protein RHGRI_035688 [Rhododendron griersonianum]
MTFSPHFFTVNHGFFTIPFPTRDYIDISTSSPLSSSLLPMCINVPEALEEMEPFTIIQAEIMQEGY